MHNHWTIFVLQKYGGNIKKRSSDLQVAFISTVGCPWEIGIWLFCWWVFFKISDTNWFVHFPSVSILKRWVRSWCCHGHQSFYSKNKERQTVSYSEIFFPPSLFFYTLYKKIKVSIHAAMFKGFLVVIKSSVSVGS